MVDYAEKRDFLRLPIDCELRFSEAGKPDQMQGILINLSSKGILFTSDREFEQGSRLEIILTPSNSQTSPMVATVEVARVINNDALFEIAGEIKDISN